VPGASDAQRQQPPGFGYEDVGTAGLDEDLVGAGADRTVGVAPIAIAGDGQDRNGAGTFVGTEPPAELDSVNARYRDVRQDEIGTGLNRLLERLQPVVRLLDSEAVLLEGGLLE